MKFLSAFLPFALLPFASATGSPASRQPWLASGSAPEDVAPLSADPEVRWSFGPFAFEGEPLAADGRVIVAGRDPTGRRAVVVLDLASGRLLSRTLLAAAQPLALALSGERLAVRTEPARVDLYRLRGGRFLAERSFVHPSSLSAPHLEGEELLLREGGELAAYALDRSEARWRARVPGAFAGAPVVRGEAVFAVWFDASGTAHLSWLARTSGAQLGDAVLGHPTTAAGSEPDGPELVAHESLVFARLPGGIPATNGGSPEWVRVPFDGRRFGRPTLHGLFAKPLESDGGWIAPERQEGGGARWILAEHEGQASAGRVSVVELASPRHHTWLAASLAPASRAGEVLYLGPCAADARSLRVLWRRAEPPEVRAVPVPGGLLVIEHGILLCLGTASAPPDRDAARAHELAVQRERALGERLAQLASKALRSGDTAMAQRLVPEAEALGASGRTLDLVRAEAERRHAVLPGLRAEARQSVLQAEEREARAVLPRELAEAARKAIDPRDTRNTRALLAELFRRAPEHAEGLEVLQRLLPPGAPPGDALSWLSFLERASTRPMSLLVPSADGHAPTPEEQRLANERERWRPDAVAYQSEHLLLVTADARPAAVARTLEAGELVCEGLARLFGGENPGASRLELVVYPTRAEYLEHSGSDLGGLESVLGFTAGHFDLAARLSRLYFDEQDDEGARLSGVSAHELVHHWLALRAPFAPPRSDNGTSGFWIVEAIATWVEEQRLDTTRWSRSSDVARAASIDTLRNAAPENLLPWRTLLTLSSEDYTRLETRTTCTLSLDWQLGASAPRSPLQLFYAQGGALAHYLSEAEGGAHRALLTRAVEAWYRGTPLDVAAELGLSPENLGQGVARWAREQAGS